MSQGSPFLHKLYMSQTVTGTFLPTPHMTVKSVGSKYQKWANFVRRIQADHSLLRGPHIKTSAYMSTDSEKDPPPCFNLCEFCWQIVLPHCRGARWLSRLCFKKEKEAKVPLSLSTLWHHFDHIHCSLCCGDVSHIFKKSCRFLHQYLEAVVVFKGEEGSKATFLCSIAGFFFFSCKGGWSQSL